MKDSTPTFGGGYDGQARPRMGFFTDTSVCIGCKACEVACKEWKPGPGGRAAAPHRRSTADNTGALGASTWRHVAFVTAQRDDQGLRWLMSSDVRKHCSSAACLEVCPRGAVPHRVRHRGRPARHLQRRGYCVPACPFGVIDRREDDGRAFKSPSATTGCATGWSRPAPRPARPTPSSSASWTSCGGEPSSGWPPCARPG